jgi:hypothetical protein
MADQAQINREYFEKLISLTANPEWVEFVEELKKEIYQEQANVFDSAQSWDDVQYKKGWCEALNYVITTRDRAKTYLEQLDADL